MTEIVPRQEQEWREDLLRRLRRIEGQAQGVQRMLQQERNCVDILDQLKSIRSAAYGACLVLMRQRALECFRDADERPNTEAIDEMMDLLLRLPH